MRAAIIVAIAAGLNPVVVTQQYAGGGPISGIVSFTSTTTMTPAGTTQTVDWSLGNIQKLDLENATGNVTVTFSGAVANSNLTLLVQQDGGGAARNITITGALWGGGVVPTISTGNDAIDIISCTYIGTSYYCDRGAAYQ